MLKLQKIFSFLRSHKKKSVFFSGVCAYGVNYGMVEYEIDQMMTHLCEEAVAYGDVKHLSDSNSKHIAVILNPSANRRKAKKYFEKYSVPLLHLSGAYVSVLESEGEGDARKLIEKVDPKTDVLVIAGGDGTVSEALTGIMRNHGEVCRVPIGVIPLGHYNSLFKEISNFNSKVSNAEKIGKATMAVIRGEQKRIHCYRVEPLGHEGKEKTVYGLGTFEWGGWQKMKKRIKELWYLGFLKQYIPLIFSNPELREASVLATLRYSLPCAGCSNCYLTRPDLSVTLPSVKRRWWIRFSQERTANLGVDYKSIENEECGKFFEKKIYTTDLSLRTNINNNSNPSQHIPKLLVSLGPKERYQGEVLFNGLKYLKDLKIDTDSFLEAKEVEILPDALNQYKEDGEDNHLEKTEVLLIDNEEYELRPVRISVLPNSVSVFCDIDSY